MLVGSLLKEIRKSKSITLQELSNICNLSTAYISNLERDQTSPTLVQLQQICTALDINITELLSTQEVTSPVLKKDERKEIFNLNPNVKYESTTNGNTLMKGVCLRISKDYHGEEISFGHNEDEFGIIASGTIQMDLDGKIFVLSEGDSIYIPAHTPHKYKNVGDVDCITYWTIHNTNGTKN